MFVQQIGCSKCWDVTVLGAVGGLEKAAALGPVLLQCCLVYEYAQVEGEVLRTTSKRLN